QIDIIFDQPGPLSSTITKALDDEDSQAYSYGAAAANDGSFAVLAHTRVTGAVDSRAAGTTDLIQTNVKPEVTLTIDDIDFTAPGFTTTTPLDLDVSGFFDAHAMSDSSGLFATGSAGVSVLVNWDGGAAEYTGLSSTTVNHNTFPAPQFETSVANNDLAGVTFPTTISLGPMDVSLNQAYTLRLCRSTFASTQVDGFGMADAGGTSDFGHTLGCSTNRPVSDLPAGYSVNAASADIVDNQWLGTPVSVSLVPLPAAAWLLAPALALLARARRPRTV
ncbi:MAG: hypothetical protein RLW62_06625, partial [Gammaproteobacteria bacterium]